MVSGNFFKKLTFKQKKNLLRNLFLYKRNQISTIYFPTCCNSWNYFLSISNITKQAVANTCFLSSAESLNLCSWYLWKLSLYRIEATTKFTLSKDEVHVSIYVTIIHCHALLDIDGVESSEGNPEIVAEQFWTTAWPVLHPRGSTIYCRLLFFNLLQSRKHA